MDIKEQLKNSVRIDEVASRLGLNLPIKTARGFKGMCPAGHSSNSRECFNIVLDGNYGYCFNCGQSWDVIGLVEQVRACEFQEALVWLVNEFQPGLKMQLRQFQPDENRSVKRDYLQSELYEEIYKYGKELLYTPCAKEQLDYLTSTRCYDLEKLKNTDWIYFPSDIEIKENLLQKLPEAEKAIQELKLQGFAGDNFRLAFPYRDINGLITAFIKRSTKPEGVSITRSDGKIVNNIRYDSTPGTGAKHDLFNFHACHNSSTIIIVEGYPDALYLKTLGFENIVAVGQGVLSPTHLEGLKQFDVKNVIIAFDNDPAKIDEKTGETFITGVRNTDKAIKTLQGSGIKVFVLPPTNLAPHKDPDEFVKANGAEAFRTVVNNAVAAPKWGALRIVERHDIQTDIGREEALQDALKMSYEMGVADREKLIAVIQAELNLRQEFLEEEFGRYHKKREDERRLREYKEYFSNGLSLSADGDLVKLDKLMDQKKKFEKQLLAKIAPYSIDAFMHDISISPEGLKTGFSNLDEKLVVPSDAMTIIAGRPSHGKTTVMLNLCMNMVEQYPEKSFLFFTYEEPVKELALKLLNMTSGAVIDETNNQKMLRRYLKGGHTNNQAIEQGKLKLDKYFHEERLHLVDARLPAKELYQTINQYGEDHDIGAVFIDYIQKIPSGGQFGTRQLELQCISNTILDCATTLNIPIILGAQLNREKNLREPEKIRLENLREAGDIEQDANLVIALYNEAMEKSVSAEESMPMDVVPLSIQVLKNRNGIPMLHEELQFQRSTLQITAPVSLHHHYANWQQSYSALQ